MPPCFRMEAFFIMKKINTLFVVLFILLCCLASKGQENFNNRYIFNKPAVIFSGIEKREENIVVAGLFAFNLPPRYPCKSVITVFDNLGNSMDSLHYYLGNLNKEYCTFLNLLLPASDKGWIVGGYTVDTNQYYNFYPVRNQFIIKYDSLLNIEFYNEFEDTTVVWIDMTSICQTSFEQLYILGRSTKVLANPGTIDAIYSYRFQIIKTDKSGNRLWTKLYNPTNVFNDSRSILPICDTALLIGWCSTNINTRHPSQPTFSNTKLSIIDTAGNLLSTWTDPVDSTFAPTQLIQTNDGGIAYATTYKKAQQFNGVYYADVLLQGRIVKLDSAFNKIWTRNTGVPAATNSLNFIRELEDGSLITGGQYYDSIINFYASSSCGWLYKLTANGDSLWSRLYRGVATSQNLNYFSDIVTLDDGSIVACGQSLDYTAQTQSQQGWLIRVDSMGCLIPGCDTLTSDDIKEKPEDQIGVRVYPNPTSDMLYVMMKADNEMQELSFELLDLNGKKVAEESNAATDITYFMDLHSFSKGVYLLIVKSKGVEISARKIVKQ